MRNNNPEEKIDFSDFYDKNKSSTQRKKSFDLQTSNRKVILIVAAAIGATIAILAILSSAINVRTNSKIQFPDYVSPQNQGGV